MDYVLMIESLVICWVEAWALDFKVRAEKIHNKLSKFYSQTFLSPKSETWKYAMFGSTPLSLWTNLYVNISSWKVRAYDFYSRVEKYRENERVSARN